MIRSPILVQKAQEVRQHLDSCLQRCRSLLSEKETRNTLIFEEIEPSMQFLFEQLAQLLPCLGKEDEIFFDIERKLFVNVKDSFHHCSRLWMESRDDSFMKLEFELIPLLRILGLTLYYCTSVKGDTEKEAYFDQYEYESWIYNEYVIESEKKDSYLYDVTCFIVGYNHFDYTKQCVESFFKTINPALRYELILFNHGSTDETKEFFQSVRLNKQIDIKVNDLTFSILTMLLIAQGKYVCTISNDIVLCKNSIENLLTCIKSDESHKYVVPSTTHMLNGQEPTLPTGVETLPEILNWAEENNISNSYLWEHRVILFNPVSMYRTKDVHGFNSYRTPFFLRFSGGSEGNDSIMSALVRRSGNKCILAKDAFCYHHGAVTRKEENIIDNKEFWDVKHAEMKKAIHIKHFSTGRCYSLSLLKTLDFPHTGHIEILGLNCGLSSDPLKIKESYKEHHHNLDCFVTNVQDTPEYKEDLPSISDSYLLIDQYESVLSKLRDKNYQWIFYIDKFSFSHKEEDLYQEMKDALTDDGVLILGQPTDLAKAYFTPHEMVEYEHREQYVAFLIYKK